MMRPPARSTRVRSSAASDVYKRQGVNRVGVEVNTASPSLLSHVSGLGPQLAANIVAYRDEEGPYRSRAELKKVPRLGPKAFEQAAGFLRVRGGAEPLDAEKPCRLLKSFGPKTRHLLELCPRAVGTFLVPVRHNVSGQLRPQAGDVTQKRRTRRVHLHPHSVHPTPHHVIQTATQGGLIHVVLVLTYADRLGIYLHQLRQRILEATANGDGTAHRHILVR